ncbi:MAG: hypothetical protein QOH81_966 [Sphingomonadales bacterium]|jgi:hypothetical protein|nr:hypothetical protein [Sphingomonadales bacterium]
MDLSMFPPEIQEMMRLQLAQSGQDAGGGGGGVADPGRRLAQPGPAPQGTPLPAPDPMLAGNDALRRQFAGQPGMQPWLDQREAHLLGHGAADPALAPGPSAAPQMQAPDYPQPAPSAPPPPPAAIDPPPVFAPAPVFASPPRPAPPPMLADPPAPRFAAAPHPLLAGTPLPRQAPLISEVSPAPAAPASAQIDNRVAPPQRSFAPAWQPPALPSFLNATLVPNPGAYRPGPAMPGYGLPRSGNPFRPAARNAPLLPGFDAPFAGAATGGPIGPGGGADHAAPTLAQQPYDESLYSSFLRPISPGIRSY